MEKELKCTVLILAVLALLLGGCGTPDKVVKTLDIQTPYGVLKYPVAHEEHLRYEEISDENVTMEIFYMQVTGGEREIFRIYYGTSVPEGKLGYLTVEDMEIPVSYTTCEYEKTDFPDDASWELYFTMMDGFNMILESITSDQNFSETRAVAELANRELDLQYWSVTLPENISCVETQEAGCYRASFYGSLGGEELLLYTVQIGNVSLETELGVYNLDGSQTVVSMESSDSVFEYNWADEDRMVLYEMMDTINDVIQAIMESEGFVE